MLIRLNKFLSEKGICSRRNADEHILAGKVKINDQVAKPGQMIDPDKDIVKIDEKVVSFSTDEKIYYALYKPKGIITTAHDEQNRKSIIDLVPTQPRVYPIGRLDKDSEGLILLTNDGELTQQLTHPKFVHEKEYEVIVEPTNSALKNMQPAQVCDLIRKKFLQGLKIEGKLMIADKVTVSLAHNSNVIIKITIHTGYNRQIRKMCAKINLEVKKLTRIRVGKLTLRSLNLKQGEFKKVSREQIL